MGIDNFVNVFQLSDGTIINCFIYDTCGQERYQSINESYYRNAGAVLLVYDISCRKSFENLTTYYVEKIKENCIEGIPILLLGNKADLEDKREVTKEEGIALACKYNFEFKESSCLQNKNVAGAFEALAESWNFQRHSKNDSSSKKSEKKKRFKKSNTEYNLENYIENNYKERSKSTYNNIENFGKKTIILKAENTKVKKKHNCCVSKKRSNEI